MTETTKIVLTKEEKIAKIEKEIARLEQRRFNVENDIIEIKAKKEPLLPAVGTDVLFRTGRLTTSTVPVERVGRVVAVKPSSVLEGGPRAGKKSPAQIKVAVGSDFDEEYIVIYPAQIVDYYLAA